MLPPQNARHCNKFLTHYFHFPSVEDTGAAFASIFARVAGESQVAITAAAHSVLSLGALSGYNLDPTSYASNNPSPSSSGGTGDDRTDIEFIEDSFLSDDVGAHWFGTSTMEELPGGGLHRHVRNFNSMPTTRLV